MGCGFCQGFLGKFFKKFFAKKMLDKLSVVWYNGENVPRRPVAARLGLCAKMTTGPGVPF